VPHGHVPHVRNRDCGRGKYPGTSNVYSQAETGNRDSLGKMDRHGCKEPADGFVNDEQRDHREDNGAGEIAELAGAEREVRIAGALLTPTR
jgi:hypothetical protein